MQAADKSDELLLSAEQNIPLSEINSPESPEVFIRAMTSDCELSEEEMRGIKKFLINTFNETTMEM